MSGSSTLESDGKEPESGSVTVNAVDRVFGEQVTEGVDEYGNGDRISVDGQCLYGVAADWTAEFEENYQLPKKLGLAFAIRLKALLADFRKKNAQHLLVE